MKNMLSWLGRIRACTLLAAKERTGDPSLKVTIKDIARMAEVSISTVSRVVNGSKPVNEDVRRRVMDVMRQMNYRPELTARADEAEGAPRIGLIMPQDDHTVLSEFSKGIQRIAGLYGYDVLFGLTDGSIGNELHYLNLFQTIRTQGLLFVGSSLGPMHLELIGRSGLPCVLAGQESGDKRIPSVHVDNRTASYEAVTYLLQQGRRDIAMIRAAGAGGVGEERYKGYEGALQDAGLPIRQERIAASGFSVEDGMAAMRRILEQGPPPDAVFCAADGMAIGAMNYLMDEGLRVPDDIAVFGFDNSSMATAVRPQLSSVEYSATEIGMTAARKLVKLIRGESVSPMHTNVAHDLKIRGSTG